DAELQRISRIDDAILLHLRDGIGQQRISHFRIPLLDQLISRPAVTIDVVIPADRRGIDEALHEIGTFLYQIASSLDQGRVTVETMMGQQEHRWFEVTLTFDRKRF